MRTHPIGTGPFEFVAFRQNEYIKLTKNEDYWREGLPYLDGIEFSIIASQPTRMLSFIVGEHDLTFPSDVSVRLLKDVQSQAPQGQGTLRPHNITPNLIINSAATT